VIDLIKPNDVVRECADEILDSAEEIIPLID